MMTNKKTEVRYTLTHGCRYKVFIKACHDDTLMARENFINFVKKNPKEFHISQRVEHKLLSPKPYIYGSCYFFVSNDRYLLITQMMLQPIIKDTVKIITTNDINQGTAA
jgi:hypothetical protein